MSDSSVRRIELEVEDGRYLEIVLPQKDVGEEAVVVWDAALVLAYFLLKHRREYLFLGEQEDQKGVNVVELGAGTGAVGLVAAALGARRVTLTDFPRFVTLLKEGIDLNKNALKFGKITASPLTWGSDDFRNIKPVPDLILASDCLYYQASVDPLISTLKNLCDLKKGCKVLLSYENREEKKTVQIDFFRKVHQDFHIRPFKTSQCHEEFSSDDIRVIELLPKII